MPDSTQQVPTLLLGLGGIGSQIVDRIYGMIDEKRRERIAVHAFDTNVNDIKDLEHLEGHVTQTSDTIRVRDYLHLAGPVVEEWFPSERPDGKKNTILLDKPLTEGAGQVRPVSRLAFRASIGSDGLEGLKQEIRQLQLVQGNDLDTSMRIMIVCSIVGGTGAGMFLQTALYLQEYLQDIKNLDSFLIRGAFLLPDILVKCGVLPNDEQQKENVRANAYASLKELDAITRNVGPNIELEYRPGQVDAEGHPDLTISDEDTPFKFSFLYDYENKQGGGLSSFEHYLRQAINTLHLQLFSPLSDEYFSEEDNDIIRLIEDDGRNRYCSAGVATLEYPYEDIVEYCALRWAESSLSSKWLRLDREYERELDAWRRDKKVGDYRPKPEKQERYPKLLEMYATEDNPDPFFRQTYRSIHEKDEDGSLTTPKAEAFVEALEAEIKNRAESDDEIQNLFRSFRRALEDEKLDQTEHAEQIVTDTERVLNNLEEAVGTFINNNKDTLFNQIVFRDFDEPKKSGGQPYRLNTWILEGSDAPLHPVAVRCFLYQVKQILDEKVQSLRSDTNDLRSAIKSYEEDFNIKSTERREGPIEHVRSAKDQSLIQQLFNTKLSNFADLYSAEAPNQMQRLRHFLVARLKQHVLSSLLDAVEELLEHHKKYFRGLKGDVFEELERRIGEHATEHEEQSDPTRRFVLASQEDKERLWDELRTALASDVLISEDIARQIYVGHYDRYCRKHLDEPVPSHGSRATAQLFEDQVLDWCRSELRKEDTLDKNIFEALRTSAQMRGYLEDEAQWEFAWTRVSHIEGAANPWLNPDKEDLGQDFTPPEYWGAHPDAVPSLSDDDDQRGTLPDNLTKEWFGNDLVRNPAFSRYELTHYKAIRGLRATNLPEFDAGGETDNAGQYYKAYRSRVRKLTGQSDETSVTPHLDKRWHLPAYLADTINPDVADKKKRRVGRAFAQGLALGLFTRVTADQQTTWQFDSPEGSQLLRIHGTPCSGGLHALHEALKYDPAIVDIVLEKANTIHQEDKTEYPMTHRQSITQHRFHDGCHDIPGIDEDRNLLDAVFSFATEAPGQEEVLDQSVVLLEQTLEEIREYYRFVFGSHQTNTAADSAANLMETLRDKSAMYEQADESSYLRNRWDQVIDSKINDLRQ